MKPALVVRKISDRSEVARVEISNLNENHVERVMMGMMRNMDMDNYFIDDSEIDEAREKQAK